MTTNDQPDPWLRGPISDMPPPLQPLAYAFIAAREDIGRALTGIGPDELWARPGGIAALGFHLAHLSGSTDRLLTYARGETLADGQRANLARERTIEQTRPSAEELIAALNQSLERSLDQLAATDVSTLAEPRAVGRAQSASSVLGILFHAAEHAARHAGQIVSTANLIRGSRPTPDGN